MKTVYIAKANIPSTSANSVHVMKISEAFADLSQDFQLIIPQSQKEIEKSFEIYGVKSFSIETVKIAKKGIRNRYGFPLKSMWKARKAQSVITRDPLVALLAVFMGKQAVLDLHGDLKQLCGRSYRIIKWKWFVKSKRLHLVMISEGLQNYYLEKYGVDKSLSRVLPDGYTESNYNHISTELNLAKGRLNIGYCGSFMRGKGLELIQRLAEVNLENHYNIFGGTKEEAEKEVGKPFTENVFFGGYIPNAKVPKLLADQDILLLPNQNKQECKGEDIGKVTSPIKMFEYMASGRVIIASDLPVLREILNETNSYLANAEDVSDWMRCINEIIGNKEEAIHKAQKAKQDVKQYTWGIRAKKMLALIVKQ